MEGKGEARHFKQTSKTKMPALGWNIDFISASSSSSNVFSCQHTEQLIEWERYKNATKIKDVCVWEREREGES